jgi:predicted permease
MTANRFGQWQADGNATECATGPVAHYVENTMQRGELIVGVARRAARGLRRSPGFTAAVIASLALGVGANTAVFSLVRHALLRPLPYPEPDQLVAVGTSQREGASWESTTYNLSPWQGASRTLTGISWVRSVGSPEVAAARAERVKGARAAPNLLEVLRVRPALGRWFTTEDELRTEPVVVLSHALWQRQFGGDPGVVGRSTLRVYGRPFTVVGVLPPGVGYPTDAEFWYPYPDNPFAEVVARARPGVSVADVRRELWALAPGVEASRRIGMPVDIVVATLHERLYGANGPALRLLLGTGVLLLVLACTNVANLSLARTLERRRELAVSVALGASRRLLAAHVLAENALLACGGGAAGALAAAWATGLLVRLAPPELPGVRGAAVGAGGVLFAAGAAMLAALAVSVAPTLAVTRGDLRAAMGQPGAVSSIGTGGAAARRTRGALVAAQFAVALLLLTASGLLVRSMARLTRIDTGFDRRGLVTAHVRFAATLRDAPARRRALKDDLVERLRALPGVRSVAVGPPPLVGGSGPGFSDGWDNIYPVRDSTEPGAPVSSVWVKYVDPSYLETFRIGVRAGRGITAADDAGAPAVALVNAAAERLFFSAGPALGRRLEGMPQSAAETTSGGRPITVVGLLPDVRQRDVTIPAYPEVWLPLAQQEDGDSHFYVSARTGGNAEALARAVRGAVAALAPELQPRRISTMDAVVRQTLAPQRYVLGALGSFAALALVLAALGLYAVMSYLTAARTREIGVRMALGARPGQVLRMVLRDGLRLAVAGAALGLPAAYASSRVMARFLYEVDPRDALVFLAAPTVLALAALIAAYIPARRATQVDPVTALRAD